MNTSHWKSITVIALFLALNGTTLFLGGAGGGCEICTDEDRDRYAIDGGTCGPVDCDDTDPETYPGAPEVCDGEDDDCDGVADDGAPCALPHAEAACAGAAGCVIVSCEPGWADCDGEAATGCECRPAVTLFEEPFDTNPFSGGRWGVYKYGEAMPGTVNYLTDGDGCGSSPGYVERHYDGHRDLIYEGPPFTTAGHEALQLSFRHRADSGATVQAYVLRDGAWYQAASVGTAAAWTETVVDLAGTVTGIYFTLAGGRDDSRSLDCITLTGRPECSPPVSITIHPSDITVCTGDTAVFTVAATGTGLAYRWRRDGIDLDDGGGVSGAHTERLEIAGVTRDVVTDDRGVYDCVVTGDCGTDTSAGAVLTILEAPVITGHPRSQEVPHGGTAVFTVAAEGAGTLAYQWQKDGADLSDGTGISGTRTAQLAIAGVTEADPGSYRCVVTDDCGTSTSSPAVLTVLYEEILFAEPFDTNPFSGGRWGVYKYGDPMPGTMSYLTGGDACGSTDGYIERHYDGHRDVFYEGTPFTTSGYDHLRLAFSHRADAGATVQAYVLRDGAWVLAASVGTAAAWTETVVDLTGTVTGIYFTLAGGTDDSRSLDCIVITGRPECTPPVTIATHPTDLGVCPGETAVFAVTATGSSLAYRWQKDGADLDDGGGISGAHTAELEIAGADLGDQGHYDCVVTGDCGTEVSDPAALVVGDAPSITEQPSSQEVCSGRTATFTVTALGAGTLTHRWSKDGVDLYDGGPVSGAATDTLPIADATASDEGLYRCAVTDDCGTTLSAGATLTVPEACGLEVSPGGHYVTLQGRTLMLVGDSGTQVVPEDGNLDHRAWIDDCAARGIHGVHVWAIHAVRQKQDGSEKEDRYGCVIPALTPWARQTSGAPAHDQLHRWNLRAFDEGAEGDFGRYWPRMRDLCTYAKARDVAVGVTVFFGWPKHSDGWAYHPFNVDNGGHLTDRDTVQIIASPGTEVWQESWSDGWPAAKKTQWVWERLSKKFIDELDGLGNVFFVFMDEHSYSEGNCGDHFMQFFRSRGAVWVDWDPRRSGVDFVYGQTFGTDKNAHAVSQFHADPVRPYFLLEAGPYMGDELRTSIWSFSIGGGHYFFHADEGQETVRTGIMGYDPYIAGGDKGMVKRDWLGHASRLFNDHVVGLDTMAPHNELTGSGTYCLADPGREYVVYSKIGSAVTFTLNLGAASGKTLHCRFYNPRTGQLGAAFTRPGGGVETFTKPDAGDWALHAIEGSP